MLCEIMCYISLIICVGNILYACLKKVDTENKFFYSLISLVVGICLVIPFFLTLENGVRTEETVVQETFPLVRVDGSYYNYVDGDTMIVHTIENINTGEEIITTRNLNGVNFIFYDTEGTDIAPYCTKNKTTYKWWIFTVRRLEYFLYIPLENE